MIAVKERVSNACEVSESLHIPGLVGGFFVFILLVLFFYYA